MFDSEQYSTNPYHSQYIHPSTQPSFFPYIYPTTDLSNSKPENYICKWIDPETHRLCNQTFSHMQDIGNCSNESFFEL